MPNIVDVIVHSLYGTLEGHKQLFVVIDFPLNFLYERKGKYLVAHDDGFYSCYEYGECSPGWQAFAGRKFDIPMKDGSIVKAFGQWWDGGHAKNAPEHIVPIGVATIPQLHSCYVFSAGHISKAKLDEWLSHNEPSTEYHKYDKERSHAMTNEQKERADKIQQQLATLRKSLENLDTIERTVLPLNSYCNLNLKALDRKSYDIEVEVSKDLASVLITLARTEKQKMVDQLEKEFNEL